MGLRQKGPTLVGVLWMETVLCMIILSLRMYTRVMILRNPGWDDFLLVFTWLLMVTFSALCTASATYGMGVHATELDEDQTAHGMFLLLTGQSVVAIAMGVSKVAVAQFLMRIVVNKWHKAFLWFWNITIMALSILLAVVVFTQCSPVQSIWDTRVKKDHCTLDLTTVATVMCAWSAVLDFVLALFPWYALWKLNMKRKEKITICMSLSLGVFAGICGIIRTTSLGSLSDSTDYLYATTDSVIWTNSELTTTIVCVSVPALRPLYRSLRGLNSSKDASNYNNLGTSGNRSRKQSYGMDTLITSVAGKERDVKGPDVDINDHVDDDGDTRGILSGDRGRDIYQTREVIVSYEERQGGEGGSVEGGASSDGRPVRARHAV